MFGGQWEACELGTPLVTGSRGMEVPARLCEAQQSVRAASNPVGVMVVLPEAHGTDLEIATLVKRQEAAAGTAVRAVLRVAVDGRDGVTTPASCDAADGELRSAHAARSAEGYRTGVTPERGISWRERPTCLADEG